MPLLLPPLTSHLRLFLLSNTCNTRPSIPAGNCCSVSKAPLEGTSGGFQQRAIVESEMLTAVSAASLPTENLEYNVEPQEISHPDVGRYFSEFTGTHYIPNAELEIRYPEDLEFVYETVQNIYSAKEDTAE